MSKKIYEQLKTGIVTVLAYDANGNESRGSGVVVSENEVATNFHVVEAALNGGRVIVKQPVMQDGQPTHENFDIDAEIIGGDRRDMCLLYVPLLSAPPAPTPVKMGTTKDLFVGGDVYALGTPKDLVLSLTRGIISQLRDGHGNPYQSGNNEAPIIQTDASTSKGSSGGGLFDSEGRLLGITASSQRDGEGLHFAHPVEWIEDLRKSCADKIALREKIAQRISSEFSRQVVIESVFDLSKELNETNRVEILAGLSKAHIKAGEEKEAKNAFESASGISDVMIQDLESAYGNRAVAAAHLGDLKFAQGIAQQVSSGIQGEIFAAIGEHFAHLNKFGEAYSFIEKIESPLTKITALAAVVEKQIEAKEKDAKEAIDRLSEAGDAGVLSVIADGIATGFLAKMGHKLEATLCLLATWRNACGHLTDMPSNLLQLSLTSIAVGEACLNYLDGAVGTVNKFGKYPWVKAMCYAGIAKQDYSAGNTKQGMAIFKAAAAEARCEGSPLHRARALVKIAESMAKVK